MFGCLSAFRVCAELSVLLGSVPVTFHFTNTANRFVAYSQDFLILFKFEHGAFQD